MIDYLQLKITDAGLFKKFKECGLLVFKESKDWISSFDREVINTKTTKHYKEILFVFSNNNLIIKFRPHYFKNNNLHNADDFSVNDCINVIFQLKQIFSLSDDDLKLMMINNIEFGLNVKSVINVFDFLDFLFSHNKNEFKFLRDLKYFKESSRSLENIVKAYSKYMQYPEYCELDTYRFDIRHKRARLINENYNIYSLFDLLNFDCYQLMRDKIIHEFSQLLILHYSINPKGKLTEAEKQKLNDFTNPLYWRNTKKLNRNTFNNRKRKYFELLDKIGFNIHSESLKNITKKLDMLTESNFKNCAKPTISIIGNCTISIKKVCPITGISLKHEDEDAKYIRTSTLKFLKENEPATYELIKFNLTHKSKRKPKYESSEFSHLAKQVRNNYFNPKTSHQNVIRILSNQLNLFS